MSFRVWESEKQYKRGLGHTDDDAMQAEIDQINKMLKVAFTNIVTNYLNMCIGIDIMKTDPKMCIQPLL